MLKRSMRSGQAANDRLLLTLLIASLIHAGVMLGVSFELPKPERVKQSLAITLVQRPSRAAPKEADFLAQEHQIGSGTSKKAEPRTQPPPSAGPDRPAPVPIPETPVPTREARRKSVLVQERPAQKKMAVDTGEEDRPVAEPPPKFSGDFLSRQVAEITAELNQSQETETRKTRRVYINSVNAQKYKAAAYEHAWQQKIERVGNLNYPDEARRQKLSGSLLLAVGIRQDGSIDSIKVLHSSRHTVLDEAAERIVQLAAPFAPFPEELKKEADVLVITRTWRFYNDYRLGTAR